MLALGFVRCVPTSPPVQLVDAWRALSYTLVVSDHLLSELARSRALLTRIERAEVKARTSDVVIAEVVFVLERTGITTSQKQPVYTR